LVTQHVLYLVWTAFFHKTSFIKALKILPLIAFNNKHNWKKKTENKKNKRKKKTEHKTYKRKKKNKVND